MCSNTMSQCWLKSLIPVFSPTSQEQRALLSCMARPARYHSLKLSPVEKKRRQQPEQDTPELCTGLTLPQRVQRVLSHHQAALSQRYSPSSSLAPGCRTARPSSEGMAAIRGWGCDRYFKQPKILNISAGNWMFLFEHVIAH